MIFRSSKRLPASLAALLVSLSGIGCSTLETAPSPPAAPQTAAAATALDRLFADYWEASLAMNPLQATFIGDKRYNDRLPNTLGPEFRAQEAAFNTAWLARIRTIDVAPLSDSERLSVEILRRNLERAIEGDRFPDHLIPINQFYNLQHLRAAWLRHRRAAVQDRAGLRQLGDARGADSGAVRSGHRQHA